MAVAYKIDQPPKDKRRSVPPLQNGDWLTRAEFERRYNAMPDVNKAELIEGVVYMPSPVSLLNHGRPHFNVTTWLGHYVAETPGVVGADNSSLRMDLDNMPQPDVFLMIHPESGGQARISHDSYAEGAPELVVEVAASSASIDLHSKMNAYRRNGVREYIVWRVLDDLIEWFALTEGRFDPMAADPNGVFKSAVMPGLWLDAPALLRGDIATVLRTLQSGIAEPEHAAFVQRLAASASP